jgi:hypothetical protein
MKYCRSYPASINEAIPEESKEIYMDTARKKLRDIHLRGLILTDIRCRCDYYAIVPVAPAAAYITAQETVWFEKGWCAQRYYPEFREYQQEQSPTASTFISEEYGQCAGKPSQFSREYGMTALGTTLTVRPELTYAACRLA